MGLHHAEPTFDGLAAIHVLEEPTHTKSRHIAIAGSVEDFTFPLGEGHHTNRMVFVVIPVNARIPITKDFVELAGLKLGMKILAAHRGFEAIAAEHHILVGGIAEI